MSFGHCCWYQTRKILRKWRISFFPDARLGANERDSCRNVVTSLNYLWDEVGHQERVREHVKKHATKSRVEWRVEVLGEEV